jgi:hypothetical protein
MAQNNLVNLIGNAKSVKDAMDNILKELTIDGMRKPQTHVCSLKDNPFEVLLTSENFMIILAQVGMDFQPNTEMLHPYGSDVGYYFTR